MIFAVLGDPGLAKVGEEGDVETQELIVEQLIVEGSISAEVNGSSRCNEFLAEAGKTWTSYGDAGPWTLDRCGSEHGI
jgi:hypothetical protein